MNAVVLLFIFLFFRYSSQSLTVYVPNNDIGVSLNFTLLRVDPRSWSVEYDYSIQENIAGMTRYLTNDEIVGQLQLIDKNAPVLAEYFNGPIPCLKMSENVSF